MDIFDYADIIDKKIIVTYYPNQNKRFSVSFKGSETIRNKNDCIIACTYGDAESFDKAILDYINKISGKILVFNSTDINRQEFKIPYLTYEI